MDGDAASVRDARQLVAEAMAGYDPDIRDAAILLVGEVVTNAVVHGGGRFLLQVDASPARLRVEVTDSTAGNPHVLQMAAEREHGRGMVIVDTLATNWGTAHQGTQKVVWFELGVRR
jgi:anti-sigma regulatory factor (Ser/Thr protein kinase)